MLRIQATYTVINVILLLMLLYLFILGDRSPRKWLSELENSTNSTSVSPEERKAFGYVLATHFNDQLTGSTSNLRSLQCLVGSLNVRVVEPFLHGGSILGVELNSNSYNGTLDAENTVKLSDLYDADQWHEYGMKYGYAPLVSWEIFLKDAPKQLILLDRLCMDKSNTCMACQNEFYQSNYFLDSALKFAERYNLSIVRKSCYMWTTVYDKETFFELAYGHYKPEESVLLINHFGGIQVDGGKFRIRLKSTNCVRSYLNMQKSNKIVKAMSNYISRFLPETKNNGYVSVMIRMQYFAIRHKLYENKAKESQIRKVKLCLDNIIRHVHVLKRKHHISSVFLATDMGKYGAVSFRNPKYHVLENGVLDSVMGEFYEKLFEGFLTEKNLTARMEAVISLHSSGYVALVEQNLAANGKCLVLAGGGEFQNSALKLHRRNNHDCAISNIAGC